ncbi:putative ntf2-like protein [Erysiphe neolycopersici]|uniref:Putative ntf2-like protein n=1 Tax=Erysiphe neolycopersici TaxID=212602 RepID=A0A420HDR0_9PEZI|nr:putative ntf2-like protein [Erysiphe neolycopersici]
MTLRKLYKEFITILDASFLTEDVSLHYITTLSSKHGIADVMKHLRSPDYKIKSQEFIDVVEGPMSLAVIVETKLEFINGGGPYLPSLDSNFITDRTVNLPIIHFISFNTDLKIQQIRLNWDQGALLKLVDVIGKTGRNWPINDGMDQVKLITSSVGLIKTLNSTTGPQVNENDKKDRSNTTNPTRDPHASLHLFLTYEDETHRTPSAAVLSRSSAKPPQRDIKELFADLDLEAESPGNIEVNVRNRLKKPVNSNAIAKNFGPSRLFDMDEAPIFSPEKSRNPTKFKHFEFSNGAPNEERSSPHMPSKTIKHNSQWNFEDFVTPQKIIPSKTLRANEVRHWGTSDDEVLDSPERVKKVDRPRKNTQAQFDFQDDDSHEENYAPVIGRCRGQAQNNGLSLYRDLFDEQDGSAVQMHESNIPSHANIKDRQKDFESHFIMSDRSPDIPPVERMSQDRAKVVMAMDSSGSFNHSQTHKENVPSTTYSSRNGGSGRPLAESTNIMNNKTNGIKTDGDGMGGRKGVTRSWDIGDDSDGEQGEMKMPPNNRTGQKAARAQTSGGDFWDF